MDAVRSEQNPQAGIYKNFNEHWTSTKTEKFSLPSVQAPICSINIPFPSQYFVSFAVSDTELAAWTVRITGCI